jgi:outer membrane lipoprotein-sorting protein
MFIIFFTIFSFCAEALMLPPGFVVRQFGHTRDKLSTAKIEQKVSYTDGDTFNETILFKAPNKYKVVLSGSNGNVTFVRNGEKCVAVSSQRKIEMPCAPLSSLFYHNLLLSTNEPMIAYLKLLKITPREGIVSIKKDETNGTYAKPEGIELIDYNNKPIYLIGVTDGLYKSSVSSVVGKSDINSALIDELKYKTAQLWMDKDDFVPLRVFGQYNSGDLELMFGSYIKDGNDVPFPKSISLSLKGKNEVTFNVSVFESGVEVKDDAFVLEGFKKLQALKQDELPEGKSKMIDYLKEYR